MDPVFKYGLIMQNMRVNGEKIKPMGAESSGMPTETSMKVSGRMTKQTDMESISMLTVQGMKEIGEMTSNMARARRHGQMALYMRVSTWLARSTGSVFTVGMMALAMKESGTRTKSEAMEPTPG